MAEQLHPVRLAREAMTRENGEPWRLEDLGAAIGRSKAFISSLEHGFIPKPYRMRQIATALETTPVALWPEHAPPETEVADGA